MTSYQRWGYVAFTVLAIIFLSSLHNLHYPMTTFLKPLPIFALLITVAISSIPSSAKFVLMTALFMSSLGDIALTLPLSKQLEIGLFFFLLAHLSYIGLYRRILKREQTKSVKSPLFVGAICIGLGYAAVLLHYLWPFLGDKMIPVMVYVGVILIMAMLAVRVQLYCAIGAVLFVISDSIVAIDEFVNHAQLHFFTIMLTYYLAQWFLVFGLLRKIAAIQWVQQPENDFNSVLRSI